ncbi:MAG: hypothetical protein ACDS79_16355 [Enterobacteriaceae bacterium]
MMLMQHAVQLLGCGPNELRAVAERHRIDLLDETWVLHPSEVEALQYAFKKMAKSLFTDGQPLRVISEEGLKILAADIDTEEAWAVRSDNFKMPPQFRPPAPVLTLKGIMDGLKERERHQELHGGDFMCDDPAFSRLKLLAREHGLSKMAVNYILKSWKVPVKAVTLITHNAVKNVPAVHTELFNQAVGEFKEIADQRVAELKKSKS